MTSQVSFLLNAMENKSVSLPWIQLKGDSHKIHLQKNKTTYPCSNEVINL